MVWVNLLWGVCGALVMDGFDVSQHIRKRHCLPWDDPRGAESSWRVEYAIMVVINAAIGGIVAIGMALSDPATMTPWIAIGLGAGGMAAFQKITGHIELAGDPAADRPAHPEAEAGPAATRRPTPSLNGIASHAERTDTLLGLDPAASTGLANEGAE